jgi:hypothetical protein
MLEALLFEKDRLIFIEALYRFWSCDAFSYTNPRPNREAWQE